MAIRRHHIIAGAILCGAQWLVAPPIEAQLPPVAVDPYQFTLTKGHGTPVCEAYLQRLNQTAFTEPPFCGRPESTTVSGFARLNRRFLTVGEFKKLYIDVFDLLSNQPPSANYLQQRRPDGSIELVRPVPRLAASFAPMGWTYDPPLDVENNGKGENVVMWSDDDRHFPSCSLPVGPQGFIGRSDLIGIILTPGGALDRRRSIEVLSRPAAPPGQYVPLGDGLGAFKFRGRTYLDAFFGPEPPNGPEEGDFEGRRRDDPKLPNTLGVFFRKDHKTREICEFYMRDEGTK